MDRADRKKYLIAQGAVHRAEILLAKQSMKQDIHDRLQPTSLAGSTLQRVALGAFSLIRNRNGLDLQALLPLLTGVISFLAKRGPSRKALLRGVLTAGAAAGIAAFLSKKKKSEAEGADNAV